MLILIDELVNIYKIPNAITRQYNYEKILTMYNDAMQGKAQISGLHPLRHAPVHGGSPTGAFTATKPSAPAWPKGISPGSIKICFPPSFACSP